MGARGAFHRRAFGLQEAVQRIVRRRRDALAEAGSRPEERLQLTGLVSAKEAVEIGKLSGAEAVLMGLVNHAFAGYENVTVGGSWVGTYIPHADISLRLVHVGSGKLIWSCQLSRNALNYLDRPLTLSASKTLSDPHANDRALMGATVEERIEGILRAAAREAVELLPVK